MCAGPDADVSGKGARALDGRTQSALPALAGNPTPPAPPPNPSQNNPDARAGNDPTRARRSPPERSALTDAYSSFRANAISSLPGRERCSPSSTRPRRESQTSRLGLEEERAASSVQKGGKNGRSPRVDGGSDSDSLTFECPTDTPHKRRRARSPSDTDTDDDVRSPLKRRSGARTLSASQYKPPPRVDETTTPLKDFGAGHCSMDFASLLNILDDPKDGVSAAADASLSRQNSCSLADDTCMDADVDHLMCDVVSDCLDSHPDRSASHRMEPEPFPSFSVFQPLPAPAFVGSKGLSAGEPRAKEPVGSRRGVTLCGGGAVGASALENGAADDRRAVLMMRGIRRVPGMSTGVRNGVYVVWFFLVKLGFHDDAFGGDDKSG